jgi:hypothetical protein
MMTILQAFLFFCLIVAYGFVMYALGFWGGCRFGSDNRAYQMTVDQAVRRKLDDKP